MPVNWGALWNSAVAFKTFAAGIGGAVLAKASGAGWGLWKDCLNHQRAIELRQVEHGEARKVRGIEFQRASLLSLQEAAGELYAAASADAYRDYLLRWPPTSRDIATPPSGVESIELARPFLDAQAKVDMYASRVRDQSVISEAVFLRLACRVLVSRILMEKEAASGAIMDASMKLRRLHDAIGKVVATIDHTN